VTYSLNGYGSTGQDDDPLVQLRRISAELGTVSRAAQAASRPDARYEGSDPTGTITVVMDGRQRVQDVRVDLRWDERLRRTELGEALSSAYSQAVIALLDAGSAAYDEAEALAEADPRDEPRTSARPYDNYVDMDEVRYQTSRQLEQNDMLLRYADDPHAAPRVFHEVEVAGAHEFVLITVRDGRIADLRVMASRLPADSTNGTIAREAMAAFDAAAGYLG
jgi:hypothetical protein